MQVPMSPALGPRKRCFQQKVGCPSSQSPSHASWQGVWRSKTPGRSGPTVLQARGSLLAFAETPVQHRGPEVTDEENGSSILNHGSAG